MTAVAPPLGTPGSVSNETQTRTSSLRRLGSAVKRRKARIGEQSSTPSQQPAGIDPRAAGGPIAGDSTSMGGPEEIAKWRAADAAAAAGPQPVPTIGKTQTGAKLKEGATGSDTGADQKPVPVPGRERWELVSSGGGEVVYRDESGRLHRYPAQEVDEFAGSIDPETGQVEAPAIGEFGAKSLKELEGLAETETTAAEDALKDAETDIAGREADTETQLAEGRERLDTTVQAADDIAEQAKQDASQLPGQVQDALSGIEDKYKETTDIDIDRIEGLGREAVGMAMEGKNAAAQAAVSAQQQAMRDAEARINADPNISAGRKSALLAQLRVNGSMQIATTIGANIKDFTALQTGAMVSTMQSVAAASTARNQSLAALGGAEMQAVAGAYMKAADISAGFDELRINARANADSTRFNYDNLTANYRDMKDGTSLALLDANNYVSQLPYDFALNHYAIGKDILGTDFAMKLQAGGYNNMQEALAAGEEWAKTVMTSQMFMEMIPGPVGAILGFGRLVLGGGFE